MDTKVGVYICSGCGIGDVLDIGNLREIADEAGAAVVKEHACLCEKEGHALIEGDIAAEELNRQAESLKEMVSKFKVE